VSSFLQFTAPPQAAKQVRISPMQLHGGVAIGNVQAFTVVTTTAAAAVAVVAGSID